MIYRGLVPLLAERLQKEHEEEKGHTTTVEVIEKKRILPSMGDRMDIGEVNIEIADDEIEWFCPGCHRTSQELSATNRTQIVTNPSTRYSPTVVCRGWYLSVVVLKRSES